jgi:hypothetical protein
MIVIQMSDHIEDFAENKDTAKSLRLEKIIPALTRGEDVILDFKKVHGATQSFIHALISDPIRKFGSSALEHLMYRNVNDDIREIISIVYRYMQESLDGYEE